jgi:nitroimidazol reductase NimA-like FMN-containing flavoprotein (pyridoxamine 5'-phosphate oxidase superfamily)
MEVDRNGLEVLDREECLRLLGTAVLGRIALTDGALPVVLPVNFHVVGDRILIRTGQGTKLFAASNNSVVAFEVDDIDPLWHSGWSVVVTGIASEMRHADEPVTAALIKASELLRIPRWAPRGGERIISISMEIVTGRRIRKGTAAISPGVL